MKERRFFAPAQCWRSGHITLEGEQSHHAAHVLRLQPGDTVTCFDETGRRAITRITHIDSAHTILDIIKEEQTSHILPVHLTLAQAVIKSNRMDMVIQKAAELGVDALIPFFSDNTVVELDSDREGTKRSRWQKIAVESAKQCGRNTVMTVEPFMDIRGLCASFASYDAVIQGCLCAEPVDISKIINSVKNIMVVVGPEGGFSDRETASFRGAANCVPWRFSNTVLRAETASISAVAIIQYVLFAAAKDA